MNGFAADQKVSTLVADRLSVKSRISSSIVNFGIIENIGINMCSISLTKILGTSVLNRPGGVEHRCKEFSLHSF